MVKAAKNALWMECEVRETPKQKLKDYLVKMLYRAFTFLLDGGMNLWGLFKQESLCFYELGKDSETSYFGYLDKKLMMARFLDAGQVQRLINFVRAWCM